MTEQLEFSFLEDYKNLSPKYTAIYFAMGQHRINDPCPPGLDGYDCPFDDSPILEAWSENELGIKIKQVYDGEVGFDGFDLDSCYPEIILDDKAEIQVGIYRRLCDPDFEPANITFSDGRERMIEFWAREKGRWFPD
ncbi:MAG: hypothetical protein ABIF40_05880 [archaeon]